jgi:hypothetical protein
MRMPTAIEMRKVGMRRSSQRLMGVPALAASDPGAAVATLDAL